MFKLGDCRSEGFLEFDLIEVGESQSGHPKLDERTGWFLFTDVVKPDLETGKSWPYPFWVNRFGSEAHFAPRANARNDDDRCLVSFITDMNTNRYEGMLIDAKDVEAGPVCRIMLPRGICSGTQATWAPGSALS